ncbi:hypothetical protein TacPo2_33 [Pantoea bacteriophage TacPo2]
MIRVYFLTRDCGDGTTTVDFFTDLALVDHLLETEEEFYSNEGYDYFDVPELGTISIRTE